jgi:uncharacterized membrane protein
MGTKNMKAFLDRYSLAAIVVCVLLFAGCAAGVTWLQMRVETFYPALRAAHWGWHMLVIMGGFVVLNTMTVRMAYIIGKKRNTNSVSAANGQITTSKLS